MGQPTPSDVHIDAALTDISTAYIQSEAGFVANQVFPAVSVPKQTNKYFTFGKNDWMRDDNVRKRAPGTESAGSGFTVSNDSYSCDVWATHVDIDDQLRANADPAVPVEMAASKLATQRMMIRLERQFATDYFATSIWGTDSTGGTNFTVWNDYGGSDPEENIDVAKATILANTGMEANTMVVGYKVHQALKKHPLIIGRYQTGQVITSQVLANFFEVDKYLVAKAVYATNAENATHASTFALGNHCLLCHVAKSPGIMVPSAGYNFSWSGLTGINDLGVAISNIDLRGSGKKVDRIEGEFAFDMKVVGTDLGYFFSGAIT